MTDNKPTYQDLEQRILLLEQEQRNKNEKFSVLTSHFDEIQKLTKTGHWELNLIQDKLYWSDEIYRIFECSPQEFEATYEAFLSFIHPEDRDFVNSSYQNHLISKEPYNIIHRILLKYGKIKFVNERCKSDFDSNGKPLSSLGTVEDITDRIRIEMELELARKKTLEKEHNLQDITSNFETFFNTIDDFLFVIDEQGNILHCNKTVEKRLGYTAEELKGKSILSVLPEDRRNETAIVSADVIAGKLASFQIPLVTKQGKQIAVETRASSGSWNGKPAVFGVSKDITKLKLSEEKFAAVFYLNPSACGLSDVKSGRYIEVNEAFTTFFGYTKEETIGHTSTELNIINDKARASILSRADHLGGIYNVETELTTKNGELKRVLLSGKTFHIQDDSFLFTVVHDVTEIHKAKEIAEVNEQKFSIAFHSNLSINLISNIDTGEILEVNDASEQIGGFSRAEMIGNSVFKLNLWMIDGERDKFIEILARDKKVLNFESTFRKKNGETFIGLISGQMIQIQNQNCLLSIIHDITNLKRTENELIKAKEIAQENEKKFSIAFHSSPNVSMITNIDTGEILEANDAVEQVAGFSRAETIGNSVIDLNFWMIEGARDQFIDLLRRNKKVLNFESTFRKKSGEAFIGLISAQLIEIKGQNCLLSIIHDITDRKNAEIELLKAKEKIEESESKFKNLYESLSISYLTLKDGVCIECNEATLTIYGANSKEDIIGKSPIDFSPEFQLNNLRSSEEAKRQIQTVIEKGFYTFEWLAQRKDKEEFLAEVSLKRYYYKNELYIQCLTTDITERKRIENELIAAKEKAEKSEQKYKGLFTNMLNAFGLHEMIFNEKGEPIDYVFLEVNPIWENVVGIKADNVIGKRIREIMPNIEQYWIERYGRIVLTGIPEEFIEYNASTQKYYNVSAYRHEGNQFAVVFNDITDKKQFEQELIAAKEKAEESDRLKTAFLHNMSHEIRTPLNAISGFTGLLKDLDITEEELNSYIQIIQNSSTQLISIVSDILTISSLETRQEPISISNVCINDLLDELQAIFSQKAADKNILLCTKPQLTNTQSEIFTDRTKITQVLSNLLTNALKFTQDGFIEVGYYLKDNFLEFYVKDSGIGINPEFHAKIFERFRQANQSINKLYGGTGLGLAISKAYIELLGGKIWVESEPEKGSTFYFTIPYKRAN